MATSRVLALLFSKVSFLERGDMHTMEWSGPSIRPGLDNRHLIIEGHRGPLDFGFGIWDLDLRLGFGTWIWDLDLRLDLGLTSCY